MNCKKPLKKFIFFFVLALCFYITARFCHRQTQGFRISKIRDNFSENLSSYSPFIPIENQMEIEQILSQKFHYLSRGMQSFVFESEDQHYVIKIFNNHYQRRLKFLKLPIYPFFLARWRQIQLEYNQRKLENTFQSYQIAYEELKEETGLLFLHLYPTEQTFKKIQIIDRLGIAHSIDLDKTGFLIQKKADLVYSKLSEMLEAKQIEKAKMALSSLVDLLVLRYEKGIGDNDPLIRTNFGFINDRAVQIDVGPFSKEERMKDPKVYRKEIKRITTSLKIWIDKHNPELSEHLAHSLERFEEPNI